MNGQYPRLSLRQRRLMLELVHGGKRIAWVLNRRYPTLDGCGIQVRTIKPLIAAGLIVRTRQLWQGEVLIGHEWGPTPRALEHFRPAPTPAGLPPIEQSHCDPAPAR